MGRRWIVNLLLLVLVAVLSTVVRRELDREQRIDTLTGLNPAQVEELVLERLGEPDLRLVRSAAGWRMEAPYSVAANGERIDQLVRIAATPVHRSLPHAAGAQGLGLDPPRAYLLLDGLALGFGDTDPIDHRRYVVIGEQVHLIDDGFQHHLTAPAEAYVDRRLLPTEFQPGSGTLDGEIIPTEALKELQGLTAEQVEPLGDEISGRLLVLEPADGGSARRFLISEDARLWTRLDLRLGYLLAAPPFWALADEVLEPGPAATVAPEPTR